MRSVVFDRFGTPSEVLRVEERPMPQPGRGEVRVKLSLSPIHNHDLMIIAGSYGMLPTLPAVPGTEAVGVVDALGDGVTHLRVGQRVCGGGSGMWADYFRGEAARLVPLPDSIADETACQLIAMPLSAWRLFEELQVKSGDWIIQNAANGAVGKILAQRAMEKGINIINLVRRDAAVDELAAIGIANGVSTARAGWEQQVTAITGGAPIVRGLDSVGGIATNEILSVMADESTLYVFGALAGKRLEIDPGNVLFKRATVKGFWAAKPSAIVGPEQIGRMLHEIVGRAASGDIQLPIAETFDLAEAGRATAASNTPGRPGKIGIKGPAAQGAYATP